MSNIVGVQFQSKWKPSEYYGKEYNYKTDIDLVEGDVVCVPTSKGDGIAIVRSVDVPESKIDERVMPLLKTIDRLYKPESEASDEQ